MLQRGGQSAIDFGGRGENHKDAASKTATFQAGCQGARTSRRAEGEGEAKTLPWARK